MTDVDELRVGEVVLKKTTEEQKAEIIGALEAEEDKERFLDDIWGHRMKRGKPYGKNKHIRRDIPRGGVA